MRLDPDCRDPDLLAAEVRRLRSAIAALADQDATLSVCDGNVAVTMDATLTDEERGDITMWLAECLRQAINATNADDSECAERWRQRGHRAGQMLERL